MHLICATFLKVDFGTDSQLRVMDPLKHPVKRSYKILVQVIFIFTKIIYPRRLPGS